MGHDDDKPTPANDSNDLLDELESIKGLLDDSIADDELHADIDIPILDDIVPTPESSLNEDTGLLDLQHIFDEPELEPVDVDTDIASPALDSTLAGIALNDLELTRFGLEGLDLNNLGIDIEIPDFKLQAEIIDLHPDEATALASATADGATLDDDNDFDDTDINLDELALLDDDPDLWLQDDPIADATDNASPTEAYQEQQEELFAESPAPADPAEQPIDVDFLIQDIVDEFIPQIEDQLRRRLSACSPTVIQQLAEKHLKK